MGKDLMYKTNRKGEAYYTDDGFAMGAAYVLTILDQNSKFDSLHWFDAVDKRLREDEKGVAERQRAQNEKQRRESKSSLFSFGSSKRKEAETGRYDEDEEAQALQLTTKRLSSLRREFDSLFYSMHGARIFFAHHS